MSAELALLLSEHNARRNHPSPPEVAYVLLERTLYDPPRASAADRWGRQLRRSFPGATLIPYVWHLVSHGPDDGLREFGSRTLSGPPHAFGSLQDNRETQQAWNSVKPALEALGVDRIALRTGPSVSPGALGRKRIERFVQARRDDGLATVWEPEGLWTLDEAAAFADAIGATLMWRAFVAGRPDETADIAQLGPRVWLRAEGMARRPRLNPDQLDALAEHFETGADGVIVCSGAQAVANLAAIEQELGLRAGF